MGSVPLPEDLSSSPGPVDDFGELFEFVRSVSMTQSGGPGMSRADPRRGRSDRRSDQAVTAASNPATLSTTPAASVISQRDASALGSV